MRTNRSRRLTLAIAGILMPSLVGAQGAAQTPPASEDDPVRTLVGRLDLERYKATIAGLAQYGDRRQGTQRNRDAVDWIEAQLRSYGYRNAARVTYDPPLPSRPCGPSVPGREGAAGMGAGPGRDAAAARAAAAGRGTAGQGGSRITGNRARTSVNCDPMAQPDAKIRDLDSDPILPGPVDQVYVTKIGAKFPGEMYIVGGHMDGIGYGQAANDDASGSAIVMELARVFASPDVETERSIRFVLWNGEEGGLLGARAYVSQRQALQGREDPPGSGRYPEPKWLGMVQHDMMLWDHGMPLPQVDAGGKAVLDANGRPVFASAKDQRPEADVNVEFQSSAKLADEAMKLAFLFKAANEKYASDYPASVGPHMTNTDSTPFMDLVPAISLRENERGAQIGAGWDPNWHQPTDVLATYSDKDYRLGLNAAQTTLAAIAQLTGARVSR